MHNTPTNMDNSRVSAIKPLISPAILKEEIPASPQAYDTVSKARQAAANIISGKDDRLLVIVGPCSIHDTQSAEEYGEFLLAHAQRLSADLCIVMRVYFEKPRTSVGWKGLINDPNLDNTFQINTGLRKARALLAHLNHSGLATGCELLDTISPQFFSDLIAWGAIGARTTESQIHRELASGMSCPMGFKNGTDGDVQIAIDAIRASSAGHHFLGVTEQGLAAIVHTEGNTDTHVILRGGKDGPNYHEGDVRGVSEILRASGRNHRLMVDCSHGNSRKLHTNQAKVAESLCEQLQRGGDHADVLVGTMIESHLVEGQQSLGEDGLRGLVYGQSVTDACIGTEETVVLLDKLAEAVRTRRSLKRKGNC